MILKYASLNSMSPFDHHPEKVLSKMYTNVRIKLMALFPLIKGGRHQRVLIYIFNHIHSKYRCPFDLRVPAIVTIHIHILQTFSSTQHETQEIL